MANTTKPVDQLDIAVARITQLTAQLKAHQTRITQLETQPNDHDHDDVDEGIDPHFETLDEFTNKFVRIVYRNPTMTAQNRAVLWCDQWADHPEVELLLVGLWKTYEQARAEDWPTRSAQNTMSWFTYTFTPTMDYICRPSGPFALCINGHVNPAPLGDITTPTRPTHV